MAAIKAGIIFIHIGTNASIPTGWVRETALDGVFPKAWEDEILPNNTGGNATHTHTSSSHYHSMVTTHTHTFQTDTKGWGSSGDTGDGSGVWVGDHSHSGTSNNAEANNSSSVAVTYSAFSNNPPCRKVIFVRALAGAQLATDMVALWESNTPPSNWSLVSELQGRYLLGASAGADADLSTDNGSSTNTHTITHSHTGSHIHYGDMYGPGGGDKKAAAGSGDMTPSSHYHQLHLDAHSDTFENNSSIGSQSETVEPRYKQLQAIKKGASGLKEKGIIGLWLGSLDVGIFPAGWTLVDTMKGYHIKIGDPSAAVGGSNTHTHSSQSHSHTITNAVHNHTGGAYQNAGVRDDCCSRQYVTVHTHNLTSVGNGTVSYNSSSTTADSSNNEPQYRTVALIKFEKDMGGASFLQNFIDTN